MYDTPFRALSSHIQSQINAAIYYGHDDGRNRLYQAMQYACDGGKHWRGLFVHTIGSTFGVDRHRLDAAATAVELIHAYSLVHDDLPSMDDDDIRRGKPSCHKVFGEALAVLVGDALQALAFQILADNIHDSDTTKITAISILARACGKDGMIKGQSLDIADHSDKNIAALTRIHQYKTGALFAAACELAVLHAGGGYNQRQQWRTFADIVGLAYQIYDDTCDADRDESVSFVRLLGMSKSKQQVMAYRKHALTMLSTMPGDNTAVATLVRMMLPISDD